MGEKKIVLSQRDANGVASSNIYHVEELHGTVEFEIGQMLTKAEVETLLRRPRHKVVIRGTRARA